jgi:hypothetical protein
MKESFAKGKIFLRAFVNPLLCFILNPQLSGILTAVLQISIKNLILIIEHIEHGQNEALPVNPN